MTVAHHIYHFSSLSAVVEHINSVPRTWSIRDSEDARASLSWDLRAGYSGALTMSRDGWQDGARNIVSGVASLRPAATVHTREYSFAGSRPHPVRFAVGNPKCMVRKRASEKAKPAVCIAVNVVANASANAEHMTNYGMALASYCETLTLRGYSVELLAAVVHKVSGDRQAFTWTVKHMGQPMNFSDVAFSIGHPGCFRRLGFALIERSKAQECYSYGGACDLEERDLPQGKRWIVLNGMQDANKHSRTPEDALAHLQTVIDAQL